MAEFYEKHPELDSKEGASQHVTIVDRLQRAIGKRLMKQMPWRPNTARNDHITCLIKRLSESLNAPRQSSEAGTLGDGFSPG